MAVGVDALVAGVSAAAIGTLGCDGATLNDTMWPTVGLLVDDPEGSARTVRSGWTDVVQPGTAPSGGRPRSAPRNPKAA